MLSPHPDQHAVRLLVQVVRIPMPSEWDIAKVRQMKTLYACNVYNYCNPLQWFQQPHGSDKASAVHGLTR